MPYAEAVFDISYFRNNPLPFYTLAHELYPGKFRPTISHCFIRLLSKKQLLLKLFTQNIDCLEREAGVPDDKIIEAHGSFARQHCIDCKALYPDDLMKKVIKNKDVPHCMTPQCQGYVKPDIVFFGEQLPEDFHKNRSLPSTADLCIVMGTSLTVQPFASLPGLCSDGVPRLLINKERVGGLGSRADDVVLLGECDAGIRKLASCLGWLDELEALWRASAPEQDATTQGLEPRSNDEVLEDEINTLTKEIDQALQLSNDHTIKLQESLKQNHNDLSDSREEPDINAEEGSKDHHVQILSAPLPNGASKANVTNSGSQG